MGPSGEDRTALRREHPPRLSRLPVTLNGHRGIILYAAMVRPHLLPLGVTQGHGDTFLRLAGQRMPTLLALSVVSADAAPSAAVSFSLS